VRYVLSTCAIGAALAAVVAAQDRRPRSVWDGVYTTAQVQRGEKLASSRCVACHGDRLDGGDSAPPLAGEMFNANWDGVMLLDLFDRVRMTMPLDKPGSLSRQQTADVIAYMLSLGRFPNGRLALDAGLVGQIKFESIRPDR
jgi:mono/diheme cytochrome c family protein